MHQNIFFPNYEKNILGIPNSILYHYGAKPHHKTLPILDEKLSKNYRNVILIVYDGLGMDVLKSHASDGFFMANCVTELSSVYPSTTTSALTTFETGLTPLEHGWLGWSSYFEEVEESVDLFTGYINGTEKPAQEGNNISWKAIGYKSLFEKINEVDSDVQCCRVSRFGEYYADTNERIANHIEALIKREGRKYIYSYHFQPDNVMHRSGCYSEQTKASISLFDKQIERLSEKLNDTLLIITGDHGLVDVEFSVIDDFPEIKECLANQLTREARSLSFFIKSEFMDVFPERWERWFGGSFKLMTGQEAIDNGFFGDGIAHERVKGFLGDYVAFATGSRALWFRKEGGKVGDHKASHAGLRREEMCVPLILIER